VRVIGDEVPDRDNVRNQCGGSPETGEEACLGKPVPPAGLRPYSGRCVKKNHGNLV